MVLADKSRRIVWAQTDDQRLSPDLWFSLPDPFVCRMLEGITSDTRKR